MDYLYVLIGLTGLFLGGEALVRGSVSIAHRFAIPPFVIGLTVVGFGTSTPELLVSVQAALAGVPDIALGNVIGSNIANIMLIVGVTALVWPIRVVATALRNDTVFMVASGLLLVPLFALGDVGRIAGVMLVTALAAYLIWTLFQQRQSAEGDDIVQSHMPVFLAGLIVAVGLVALLFGARFLIDGAVSIAQGFGVSEAFIGLTIIAVGTSLPELATSVIAALRRQSDIAIGNILGSNIFNVLGILGITAMVSPIPVAPRFLAFDLPVMIGASVLLAGLLLVRQQIGRGIGAIMLMGYAAYIVAAQ